MLRRSLVTDGFDRALEGLQGYVPMSVVAVPSGTDCWTWRVPPKWTVRQAWIKAGDKVVLDDGEHPLAVAPYSEPFEGRASREELIKHLRWSERWPDAFVFEYRYAANYRMRDWCFSLPYERVQALSDDYYDVHIDVELSDGAMKIGEAILPGEREEIVVIMSHLCHPGQANDGLAGMAAAVRVFQELAARPRRKYTYMLLAPPETFGTVAYLWSRGELVERLKYGIFIEMPGVDNPLCLKRSHKDNDRIDRIARHVFREVLGEGNYLEGGFRELYGNDEIVQADPDFDLPMISVQHFDFPEYHTSRDDPSTVKLERLDEAHRVIMGIIDVLEDDYVPERLFKGPAYLSRYGLYVDTHQDPVLHRQVWNIMQRLGTGESVFDMADELRLSFRQLLDYLDGWEQAGLIRRT